MAVGQMLAELVAGDEVICYNMQNKKSTTIKSGKYLYL